MKSILLAPPLTFLIYLSITYLLSRSTLLFSAKGRYDADKGKAYACGEDIANNKVQPDYSQFFSFAFLFTIMHVIVLIIATAPPDATLLSVIYLIVAMVSISILFRR